MVIFSKYLIHSNFNAVAIWPFIILNNRSLKNNDVLINHEKIHLQQQKEMLWLLFFIWYLVEYAVKLIRYKKPMIAYRNLSFERESYANENDKNYLEKREFWNFIKYL